MLRLLWGWPNWSLTKGTASTSELKWRLERWAQSQLISTVDVQEAVMAFLGKRPAKFQGR